MTDRIQFSEILRRPTGHPWGARPEDVHHTFATVLGALVLEEWEQVFVGSCSQKSDHQEEVAHA